MHPCTSRASALGDYAAMRKGRGRCERGSSQPSFFSEEEDRARNLDKADKDTDDGREGKGTEKEPRV